MFQTSQDLLYLILAIAIGLLTVFLSWLLIECAIFLRGANKILREFKDKVAKVELAICGIRDKIGHSAGYLHLLAEGIKQIVAFVIDKRASGGKKKR